MRGSAGGSGGVPAGEAPPQLAQLALKSKEGAPSTAAGRGNGSSIAPTSGAALADGIGLAPAAPSGRPGRVREGSPLGARGEPRPPLANGEGGRWLEDSTDEPTARRSLAPDASCTCRGTAPPRCGCCGAGGCAEGPRERSSLAARLLSPPAAVPAPAATPGGGGSRPLAAWNGEVTAACGAAAGGGVKARAGVPGLCKGLAH